MKTLFLSLISIYIIIRIIFIFLERKGRKTAEKEALALKYFTEEDIKNGIEYHDRGFTAGIIKKIVDFLFPLVFFFSSFAVFLSTYLIQVTSNHFWIQVIIFVTIYMVMQFIVDLPFSYYFSYVLEHKFGFSNMNNKSWLAFTLKRFIVGLIINIIIISAVYFVFRRTNFHWVWIIPLVMLLFEFFFTLIYPYVFLPIFYKKSNFEKNEYSEPIFKVAEKAGITLKKIYQINESKYSKHTNAFFTGFGPEKSIYLFDTLVKNNSPEQAASVVAHEAGHWKHHHVLKGIILGFIGSFIITFLLYFTYKSIIITNLNPFSDVTAFPIIIFIISIYSYFLIPVESSFSRKMEVTADTYELRSTGRKDIFISSMVQLAKDNRSFLYPHPAITLWYASHPPMLERIKMAEDFKFEDKI